VRRIGIACGRLVIGIVRQVRRHRIGIGHGRLRTRRRWRRHVRALLTGRRALGRLAVPVIADGRLGLALALRIGLRFVGGERRLRPLRRKPGCTRIGLLRKLLVTISWLLRLAALLLGLFAGSRTSPESSRIVIHGHVSPFLYPKPVFGRMERS
jgi:hypothetical protein